MENLFTALDNVSRSYKPAAIGVTSTCLSETIGEDVPRYLRLYEIERKQGKRNNNGNNPVIFYAATPSYRGTHMEGFHEAICAAISTLAEPAKDMAADLAASNQKINGRINLISGFVSAEDLRELHSILSSFCGAPDAGIGPGYTLLPDYSESLDGPSWESYQKLPPGGTTISNIKRMGQAAGTLYMGKAVSPEKDGGARLEELCGVPLTHTEIPIGIENCDGFFEALAKISGKEIPVQWTRQRGRLIDAYIDGHKYVNRKRAIIYGEEDFVIALASFLDEIGAAPVIAATGSESPSFRERMKGALKNSRIETEIMNDADFVEMLEKAKEMECDFIMGHSKGLYLARELKIPLIRCGFPIHDRIGGQRVLHLGYRGTLNLFDLICNTLMEAKQDQHDKGYTYI
jgi:nitrogenase molybdenum-iron protein NifN